MYLPYFMTCQAQMVRQISVLAFRAAVTCGRVLSLFIVCVLSVEIRPQGPQGRALLAIVVQYIPPVLRSLR